MSVYIGSAATCEAQKSSWLNLLLQYLCKNTAVCGYRIVLSDGLQITVVPTRGTKHGPIVTVLSQSANF